MKISIIIPTFNPGVNFQHAFNKIAENLRELDMEYEIIVIDSGSIDGGVDFVQAKGAKLIRIKPSEFNHGGTRNMAAKIAKGSILVYMTQDAILARDNSIKELVEPLILDSNIGMSYGRQLPFENADFFGRFARTFNYPNKSMLKTIESKKKLGIKTIFVSNSFAAYNRDALLNSVDGFPSHIIFGEDTYVAAKLVNKGYSIAYVASAQVYHSHNLSIMDEFHRFFDVGVLHGREHWILEQFSSPESEGSKFVIAQLKGILNSKKLYLIPEFFVRNFMKYIGYKLGLFETHLPLSLKKKLSMHKGYWNDIREGDKNEDRD
jgi:rhamnosyltransferase